MEPGGQRYSLLTRLPRQVLDRELCHRQAHVLLGLVLKPGSAWNLQGMSSKNFHGFSRGPFGHGKPNPVRTMTVRPRADILAVKLYKSVAVRDTRLSLELNSSLWRLSWPTFIFLPLTFLSGSFGMKVDVFADNPPIKW